MIIFLIAGATVLTLLLLNTLNIDYEKNKLAREIDDSSEKLQKVLKDRKSKEESKPSSGSTLTIVSPKKVATQRKPTKVTVKNKTKDLLAETKQQSKVSATKKSKKTKQSNKEKVTTAKKDSKLPDRKTSWPKDRSRRDDPNCGLVDVFVPVALLSSVDNSDRSPPTQNNLASEIETDSGGRGSDYSHGSYGDSGGVGGGGSGGGTEG